MTTEKKKHPGGRPKKPIDLEMVESLCKIQCTGEEISTVLGINYETLNNRIKEQFSLSFPEYYKKHSLGGRISLRRAMFKKAITDGNVTMMIFLAKNLLGMSDNQNPQQTDIPEPPEFENWDNKKLDDYIGKFAN